MIIARLNSAGFNLKIGSISVSCVLHYCRIRACSFNNGVQPPTSEEQVEIKNQYKRMDTKLTNNKIFYINNSNMSIFIVSLTKLSTLFKDNIVRID